MLWSRVLGCVESDGVLSGGHRGDNLDHLTVLSLDGTLDGLFHLHVLLQGRGQLGSLYGCCVICDGG